jgi:hypothetical protein
LRGEETYKFFPLSIPDPQETNLPRQRHPSIDAIFQRNWIFEVRSDSIFQKREDEALPIAQLVSQLASDLDHVF